MKRRQADYWAISRVFLASVECAVILECYGV